MKLKITYFFTNVKSMKRSYAQHGTQEKKGKGPINSLQTQSNNR